MGSSPSSAEFGACSLHPPLGSALCFCSACGVDKPWRAEKTMLKSGPSMGVSGPKTLQSTRPYRLNSRYGFAGFWILSLLSAWLILRLVLFWQFSEPAPLGSNVSVLVSGLLRDALAALWLTLPVICCLLLLPTGSSSLRVFFWSACLLFWFAQAFLLFVEYFFFE